MIMTNPSPAAPATLEHFLAAHEGLLQAGKVPVTLWPQVFRQIVTQDFRAGEHVEFSHFEDSTEAAGLAVVATQRLDEESLVFLVDHAFTFRSRTEALQAIDAVPSLRLRLQGLISDHVIIPLLM